MVSFLLIISFLLHIIAVVAIYKLSMQIRQTKQTDTDEIIHLFETYLEEIKAENNLLEKKLSYQNDKGKTEAVMTNLPSAQNEFVPDIPEPPKNNVKDKVEASLDAKILQLYNQGLTETEIAQKLNCGKTEAELIIRLYGKR